MQLATLGYIMAPVIHANRWWLVLLFGLLMVAVAAAEAVSHPPAAYEVIMATLAKAGTSSSSPCQYPLHT